MSLVHLNTAGAGLMSAATVEAMRGSIDGEAGQGSYETELQYADLLGHGLYERAAQMLNAPRANIGLFSSATEAWAGILSKLEFPLGCRVWVSSFEYAANLIFFNFLKQGRGVRVEVIPRTAQSPLDLDLDWVRRHLGAILREHPAYYGVDACQSMGQLALDVRDMHCDLLTGAGRSFLFGPRGSGIAYVSNRLLGDLTLNFADLHTARTNGQVRELSVADGVVIEAISAPDSDEDLREVAHTFHRPLAADGLIAQAEDDEL